MFPYGTSFILPAEDSAAYAAMMQEYYVWLFSRYIGCGGKQPAGLGGFTSKTGLLHSLKINIGLLHTHPSTDH